jgi:hypothetical protein
LPTLTDVADITISTQGAQLTTPAFDVPLILSTSARFSERLRFYSSLDALETDGFVAADPEHQLASALLSPDNRIDRFALGRLANLPSQVFTVIPVAVNSHAYSIEIGLPGTMPQVVTYTSDSSATLTEIITNLKTAIDALSLPVTTTNVGPNTSLTIAVTQAGDNLHVRSLDRANLHIFQSHADPGVAADLTAIEAYNGGWYAVLNAFNSTAMGLAIATWVQARTKAFVADTDDTAMATTVVSGAADLMAQVNAANDDRSLVVANTASDQFKGATWLGTMFTFDPGDGATWAFKTLAGQVADDWNDTERANIKARNGNFYYTLAGRDVTFQGTVGGGEFFDVTPWGIDWLKSEIQTELATLLFNADKIPYTDAGAQQIAAAIEKALDLGVKRGLLASNPEPLVIVPKVADVDSNSRAARLLPDVQAQATLAGAIHKTQVRVRLAA